MDKGIDHIRNTPAGGLNFRRLRSMLAENHEIKDSLKFGHAVLTTSDQLGQYLYTYGPMIESQWEHAVSHLTDIDRPTRVIDYGCGQGLAGVLLNDLTEGELFGAVREIVLIEPSALALARAGAVYGQILPTAPVTGICKGFDDLNDDEIPPVRSGPTLHLFSNSLDVLGFDPQKLLGTTIGAGHHILISVSHDRDFNGGTPRVEGVKAMVEDPRWAHEITIRRSTLERFTCNNPGRSKCVVWLCEFEVGDG